MSEFSVMTMDEIEKDAAAKGCAVVVAKPNQLQFDLDTKEAWETFQHFFHIKLCNHFKSGINGFQEWASKSGNRHVVVEIPVELSAPERIALQSQGGSDYGREFAALACHWAGSPHPILLFKPTEKQ